MTKAPSPTEKSKKATWQHKKLHQNVDYTAIAERLSTKYQNTFGVVISQLCDTVMFQICYGIFWEWDWLFNVTYNDISVIYVTAHISYGRRTEEVKPIVGLTTQ